MQDPDKTISDSQGYVPPGQAPGQAPYPPYGQPQGQFPQPSQGSYNAPPQPSQGQPPQGSYNAAPGQFSAYPYQQPAPQPPPPLQKKLTMLWLVVTVGVLLVVGLVVLVVFTRNASLTPSSTQNTSIQSTTTQNTATKSASTQNASAQSSQRTSGTNASASSSAQSSASSNNNTTQAQATAVATAQSQSQTNNAPSQAQAIAQAGLPSTVAKNFFAAVQRQDYNTAYQYTHFKTINSANFHSASTASDQTLGKLTSFTIGKTTFSPSANTLNAQVVVTISRANVPSHNGLAFMAFENGTWKIIDGSIWQ